MCHSIRSLFWLKGPHRTQTGILIGERFTAEISAHSRFFINGRIKLAVFTGLE
jgi:hypothetical protein